MFRQSKVGLGYQPSIMLKVLLMDERLHLVTVRLCSGAVEQPLVRR
jgi:hypothetical protein